MSQSSTKPYLVRAIYEWCLDQNFTPHVAVRVDDNVVVPPGYARDGQIVLNLGPEATNGLVMGNEVITFQARFGGVSQALSVPVANVIAVYARENGQGMAFELDEGAAGGEAEASPAQDQSDRKATETSDQGPEDDGPGGDGGAAPRGSHLKVVK